jgi:hypothetical protein
MSTGPSLLDRLRIERAVWTLDQRLYELPRRSRISHRRELRGNLTAAAGEVGARAAIADMGNQSTLASDFLDAELGAGPRPSWLAAALFVLTTTLLLTSFLSDAANAYGDGIGVGDPHATGTYHWHGIAYLQSRVTFTFTDGSYSQVGGAFTPLTWILLAVGAIAIGRLWRLARRWVLPRRGTAGAA